ncbi:MAG: RluA family pseudouridine synthase [Propionibacteriaceae bacterium]|jgi:23S rRNA pseudouridine1911/1915/1917 synthase|nr:RluA family pseudouridine synthase [Propionibacteriaceae bacterium]
MAIAVVPDGLDGERVDVAATRMTGMSRSRIDRVALNGGLTLDGVVVAKSARVHAGALLEVVEEAAPAPMPVTVRPQLADGMGILYDDDDIVVVDKPAAVAAHPSVGWDGPSVVGHLAAAGFRISTSGPPERQGIVQRLDVGTSGVMVVAKSEIAYSVLKQAFRDRTVEKIYHALVQGYPDPLTGTIDAPIGHDRGPEWKMAITRDGRPSVTHYATLEAHRAATLLEVHLETGRTHQIRVHMSAIHHPCAGDLLYGADPTLAARLGLRRQWLHAVELALHHPVTGRAMRFTSEYPADLRDSLELVRNH